MTDDPYCYDFLNTASISSNDNYTLTFFYLGLWLFSTIGLLFVATTIFYNKKLQAHPQMLIAYICMAECCMSYNALIQVINPVYVACYFGMDKVYAWTLFQNDLWRNTSNSAFKCATNYLCATNALFF